MDWEGYPLLVIFDDTTGDYIFTNSITSGYYYGEYNIDTGETAFQWYSTYTPSSGEYYLLHRFNTFMDVARVEIQEESFDAEDYRYMIAIDVDDEAKRKSKLLTPAPMSSSSLDSPSRPKYDHYSNGKFKKPISPRQWATRVGDDVTTNAFGIFEIDGLYRHIMSGTTFLFNIDVEEYHMSDSPMAFSYHDNFAAVDVESFTEFYCWTVQVPVANTIGEEVIFHITGSVSPPELRSSYPLGMQLQSKIPTQAIHYGFACSGCHAPAITGVRFQCCECKNFNLCSKCEDLPVVRSGHSTQHQLLKIKVPIVARTTHTGVSCNECNVSPIEGVRYKCQICEDFDLCEKCEPKTSHPANHPLIKAKQPLLLK